jgi:cyclic pyranopterin phosphate synthase
MSARSATSPLPPLLDTFGRAHTYLRISVTERCNLRCAYCMPAQGIDLKPREHILTYEEIERITRLLARMGVNKVRITGGEPLLRRDLPHLISAIARLPGINTVAMTTNGVLLAPMAQRLREVGLAQLNVSLDTLRPERFERIARRDHFARVMAGIDAALAAGFRPLKLNCVVMGGVNDDELLDFVAFVQGRPIDIRFIEFMPFAGNAWHEATLVPWRTLRERIEASHHLHPLPYDPAQIARSFRIAGSDSRIGFISSMTDNFCSGCNRVRLLCDGSLKSCLFSPPEENLREALRAGSSDAELEVIVRRALLRKQEKHAPAEELALAENNSMIEIGG